MLMIVYIAPPSGLAPGSLVWTYLRDSGGETQEQSVPQQRAEIEAYCQQYGLVLGRVFQDVARSGGSVASRDAFNELIELSASADPAPAGLLLWNFARFARDLDDSSYFKSLLRKRGLIVHSLTDPIPDGPFGRIIENLIDFANEEQRRQNKLYVKRALQTAFQKGYSFGIPPKGYIAKQEQIDVKRNGKPRMASRWIPDPDLATLAALAWKMRAEGRTYLEINAATFGRLYSAKNSWCCFFANKAYLGVGIWGELEIANHHPPLIDLATWDAVQLIQSQSRRPTSGPRHPRRLGSDRRTGNVPLLSGLAYCMHCGAAIFKDRASNGWDYYMCGYKRRHSWKDCPSRVINSRAADAAVVDAVLNRILTQDFVNDLVRETGALLYDTAKLTREKARIEKDMEVNRRAVQHLLDLAEKDGGQDILERLRERRAQQGKLAYDLRQVESGLAAAQVEITPEALALVLQTWRDSIIQTQQAGDRRGLKNLLAQFVTRVDLGYNTARIMYAYPISALNVVTDNDRLPVGALNKKSRDKSPRFFVLNFCLQHSAKQEHTHCGEAIRRRMSHQDMSIRTRPMAVRPPRSDQFGSIPRRAISRNRSVP